MTFKLFGVVVATMTVVGCGGGGGGAGGSTTGGTGGFAFRAHWANSGSGQDGACPGFGGGSGDIPDTVAALRIWFQSTRSSGEGLGACCVVAPRGSTAFDHREVVLQGLRAGDAAFNIQGFGPGPVPNDGVAAECPSSSGGTQPCDDPSPAPTPLFASDADLNTPAFEDSVVTLEEGKRVDAGDVCLRQVLPPTPTPTATPPPTQTPTQTPTNTPPPTATRTPTHTPRPQDTTTPTATPSATPTATESPTETATPSPTATEPPTPTPADVTIQLGTSSGTAASTVTVPFTLHTAGKAVIATINEVYFSTLAAISPRPDGKPDCNPNRALGKDLTAFSYLPPGCPASTPCTGVRAIVLGGPNGNPNLEIVDGAILYWCNVGISPTAPPSTQALTCVAPQQPSAPPYAFWTDPNREDHPALCSDGAVNVVQ